MGYIRITKDNIESEHICCALGAKQYEPAVNEKKKWLTERMEEGLVFYRLDERAKVFIEYLPAEMAWVPIHAPNYMYINCLWVSGRYKDQGFAKQMLDYCREDAINRGMDGIVHMVGKKKYPFLSEKGFFKHMGFEVVDQTDPYFELMALKFDAQATSPSFKNQVKISPPDQGVSIYYTAQCPFASGVIEELRGVAEARNVPISINRLNSREEAQNSPAMWTTFGLFYNGKYITHEILSSSKFEKLLDRVCSENQSILPE